MSKTESVVRRVTKFSFRANDFVKLKRFFPKRKKKEKEKENVYWDRKGKRAEGGKTSDGRRAPFLRRDARRVPPRFGAILIEDCN